MEAPLSSPRLSQQNKQSYFSQSQSQSSQPQPQSHSQGPTSAPQNQRPPPPPPQQQQHSNDASPFLRDFNLVAEAAKRAQMACLMRDLEGVAI